MGERVRPDDRLLHRVAIGVCRAAAERDVGGVARVHDQQVLSIYQDQFNEDKYGGRREQELLMIDPSKPIEVTSVLGGFTSITAGQRNAWRSCRTTIGSQLGPTWWPGRHTQRGYGARRSESRS